MVDQNRIEGAARQVKGKFKEALGKVTGNHRTAVAGKAENLAGRAQSKFGAAKDKIRDAIRR